MLSIFKSTSSIITNIDEFLNIIDQSLIVFREGVRNYSNERHSHFLENLRSVTELEAEADKLRREVKSDLYSYSLIPEYRGDVLQLLEKLDDIIDCAKDNLRFFNIEKPVIPVVLREDIGTLAEYSMKSAEAMILATRAFFRDVKMVNDRLHRVYYYEEEADRVSENLRMQIFNEMTDLHLSHKQHLRFLVTHVEKLSNIAEDAADMLTIFTIKRKV